MTGTNTEYSREWREKNRQKYRDYQREYRRRYRATGQDKKYIEKGWVAKKIGG